jgi:hypothetical protein
MQAAPRCDTPRRTNAVRGARAVLGRPIRKVHITRKKRRDENRK